MSDRAVIFDLDGTLVDTAPDLMTATNRVLADLGRRPIAMEEVRQFVGHGARALIKRGMAATGGLPSEFDLERHYRSFVSYYEAEICVGSRLFPGLVPFLDRLRAESFGLGVCTNKLEGLSIRLLEEIGIRHYFGSVVGPDTVGVAKPDPRPFHEAVARLGLASPRALMVGDSETDVLTARAAGVPILAVPFGYTARPVAEFSPDAIVGHYDDMWTAIERLLA